MAAAYGSTQLAFPVQTVSAGENVYRQLTEVIAEYEANVVYLGLPLTLSGERSFAAEYVLSHAEQLQRAVPDVQLQLIDERLSTAQASRSLGSAGRNTRDQRAVIDQAAATEILQRALEIEQRTGRLAGIGFDLEEP